MDEANLTVDKTGHDLKSIDSSDELHTDTDLVVGENETSFESLNNKIIYSSEEITLTHDYSFNEENDTEYIDGIVISKPITINGNGYTVDANGIARIFKITSPDVTLKNITFLNAFHDKGGSLYITGNDCNIIDCSFINNKATVEAGAIFLVARHGQIINSKIINCSSDLYTGAVLINSANASVIGCHFENNSANISAGAIGWAAKDNGIIRDCVFVNNSAYNEGGGAIFWNQGKNGIIQNSTFRNNYANFNGSAIFWSFGENGKIIDSIFINNEANVTGGAIYLKGNNNEMNNCNFTNNTAEAGSAVFWTGNKGKIVNCNFNNILTNSKTSGVLDISDADIEIKYCTIDESDSYNSIYAKDSLINLEKNKFNGFISVISDGGIVSPTYITLKGENGYPSYPIELNAIIHDDNENVVIAKFKKLTYIISDGSKIQTSCVDGNWFATHTFNKTGEYIVTADIPKFNNLTVGDIKVQIGQTTKFVNVTINDDLKIAVVLVNDLGLPIANANVTFNIDNETYNTTSDNSGLVMIQSASNKTVTISYSGDDEYIPANITITLKDIIPTKTDAQFNIVPRQIIKIYAVDYSAGERGNDIEFRLTDAEGNPIAGAEVTLLFKTSVYNRTTDEDGYVFIGISTSKSGKSLGVLSFLGDEKHNAVVVPFTFNVQKKTITIKAQKKTFKAKTKTKKFTVTLKTKVFNSKDKKVYLKKGKMVTLKINGKTFKAKTNAQGKATFKIKKLTKKGKYTAKIIFNGDSTYKSASKNVKIIFK